jgi:hypothetical protein
VAADVVDAFVALIHEQGVSLMETAGAAFVSCDASTPGVGGEVDVLTVWSFDDFAAWNRIRRDLLHDPRYGPYAAALAGLRRGGTRRFYPRDPLPEGRVDPSAGGPSLRRWEMFSLDPAASPAAVDAMRRAMQECDRHIPGISRCAIGTNTAGPPIDVVWGTTYASVAAYGTYMTHPYHASVLDRFLLPDCPERITTHNALGAGLVGYATERPDPPVAVGARRLVLLDFLDDPSAGPWADEVASAGADGLLESVLAENTMSTRWFDGVTDMGGRPAWTHIWDQCFATPTHLERHRTGAGAAAHVERALLAEGGSGASRSAEIVYVPETAPVPR